jgi:hypothetical protein
MKKILILTILSIALFAIYFFGRSPVIPTLSGILLLEDRGDFGDGKIVVSDDSAAHLFITRDGWLRMYSISQSREVPLGEKVAAHWLAVQKDPNQAGFVALICAGFLDRSVRVYRIALTSGEVTLLKQVVAQDDILRIDPALVFYNNSWIASYTELRSVEGDSQKRFTVQPLSSKDLINWRKMPLALERAQNLEDVRLYDSKGDLYMLFEAEVLDRGPSSLNILRSRDGGESWGAEVSLFKDGSDNEPAGLLFSGRGAELFFSSDMGSRGASYAGGEAYSLKFRDGISNLESDYLRGELVKLGIPRGVLLIDVVGLPGEDGVLSASIKDYGGPGALLRVHRF